jgi:hypothetical protein
MAALLAPCRAATSLDRTPIANVGEWEVTGEVGSEGRLAYRATLHDHADKRRNIEIKCWPSAPDRGFTVFLFDEAIKDTKSKAILVTFNNSRLGTVDQFKAVAGESYVDINRLFLELVGCGRCNPRTDPHAGPLLISIQNRKMEFRPFGAEVVWGDLAKRCHL